jgi:hypothetical protein
MLDSCLEKYDVVLNFMKNIAPSTSNICTYTFAIFFYYIQMIISEIDHTICLHNFVWHLN